MSSVKDYAKYEDNGVNVGGLLDPAITWNSSLLAFLILRPNHIKDEGEEQLAHLNTRLAGLPKFEAKEAIKIVEETSSAKFAREYSAFLFNLGANLPKLSEIEADPENARLPTDIHFQYLVASALARHAKEDNIEATTKYLARLAPDIASMASHDIEKDFPELVTPELKALQKK